MEKERNAYAYHFDILPCNRINSDLYGKKK